MGMEGLPAKGIERSLGFRRQKGGFGAKTALLPPEAQTALDALGRQALHAHILIVKNPATGEILTFRSELPPDLARLRSALAAPGGNRG